MRSQNIGYLPKIDHLRFVAALLVFVFHLFHHQYGSWKPFPELAAYALITEGHTGVTLFFVLSGFLFMCIGLNAETIKYTEFIKNRFLRIFPLYLLFFFVAISIGRDDFLPTDIFYLFFSNLGKSPTSDFFITGAAWTISIEFTFYLVFPFLAKFVKVEGALYLLRLLLLVWLIKVAAYVVSPKSTFMFYSTLIGRFDQFLIGMLAAVAWNQHATWLKKYGGVFLGVAIALLVAALFWQAKKASFFSYPQVPKATVWIYWGTLEATLWALVVVGYLALQTAFPKLINSALIKFGECSYSFYLWHGLVIYLITYQYGAWAPTDSFKINLLANFCLMFPIAMAVSALSYYTIEKPFLALRGDYVHKSAA